jgi:hypothetical protein
MLILVYLTTRRHVPQVRNLQLSFRFESSPQHFICTSHLFRACCLSQPPHPLSLLREIPQRGFKPNDCQHPVVEPVKWWL